MSSCSCCGLLDGRAGSSCSPTSQKRVCCFSKTIICVSPCPRQWVTPFFAWRRMCTVSTGGSPGIAQKCQARKHKYQHWQIGVSSFGVLQRGLQTARLTPRKDHRSIPWKCQAFVSQNRLLSSCSTKRGIFKFVCFVSYSVTGRVWAVHPEQLGEGEEAPSLLLDSQRRAGAVE